MFASLYTLYIYTQNVNVTGETLGGAFLTDATLVPGTIYRIQWV